MASNLVKGATECDPSDPRIVLCFEADSAGRTSCADRGNWPLTNREPEIESGL